jgi:cytidylate kinase
MGLGDRAVGHEPVFILVSGPPASGKSTLAPWIAMDFDLPLIAKDTIKEVLMSILPVPDVEASRQLGRAAVQVMLAVAAASPSGAVVESNFYRSLAVEPLRQLPGVVVEVFCRCDRDVAARRYRTRAGTRLAGHFDQIRSADELWNEEISEPVAGGWTVIEVDTNRPVDRPGVAARIRETLVGSGLAASGLAADEYTADGDGLAK